MPDSLLPPITMSQSPSPKKQARNQSNQSREPLIPTGQLPAYLAEAFGELYAEDGLLVLGKGLGLLSLVASFVRFYGDIDEGHAAIMAEDMGKANDAKAVKMPLVFVLGLRENERKSLVAMLEMWGTPPELIPTMITNESGQGKDRALMYSRGGIFVITTRILIVDLLTNTANPKNIDGILVAHAEHVTEQSTEAFILRIFRTQKQLAAGNTQNMGFVKAFSDAPGAIMSGFAKVDKILKALHVRRLYLYPRFHASVADELESTPPNVDELHQELSPRMKDIQSAIAAAVQTCIRELKNSTSLLEWSDTDLSVENCVTANFDMAISRQLEHDWHRLRPSTKQLVQDLRTLRTLFQSLIQYDCVGFWKLLHAIKTMSAASRHPSMWLLTPAADMLFRKSKERIYTLSMPKPTEKVPSPVARLTPVLEEHPKWRLVRQVLTEIDDKHEKKMEKDEKLGPATVLIMVKDERALDTVRTYLIEGKQRTMNMRWLRFLQQYNDRSRSVTNVSSGTSKLSEESRLLLEEESRARNFLFGVGKGKDRAGSNRAASKERKRKQLNSVPDYLKKKRRIAAERGRGEQTRQADDLERSAVLDEAIEEAEHDLDEVIKPESRRRAPLDEAQDGASSSDDEEDKKFRIRDENESKVVIRSYSRMEGDEALLLLQDIEPSYVILYDTDVSFIRAIEIYCSIYPSTNEDDRLHVFFMMFEASAEEKNFMKSLEYEQNAFERLIHHKKTMPMPMFTVGAGATQEMQEALNSGNGLAGTYAKGSLPLSVDTRTGRGKPKANSDKRDIAVDVREFRSALPSILHQGGMRLAPVTLTIGDFVLSNVHCVERKSISDLFGSFASGRLFTQAESMSKHYKCPCLLIEFDPAKSFSLQNQNELGVEIRTDAVCSKMSLLAMHFPKLRILWSRSPHETLRIFKALKTNHEEVDVDKAVEIGSNESIDALLNEGGCEDDEEDEVNDAARDMLLRLPGVNVHNARKIMKECDTIAELAEMSREKLREIAGPVTGQKLFTFFRQKMAAT